MNITEALKENRPGPVTIKRLQRFRSINNLLKHFKIILQPASSGLRIIRAYLNRSPGEGLNYFKFVVAKPSQKLGYAPLSLTLWITDRCNFGCDFCLRNKTEAEYKHQLLPDMSFRAFKRILGILKYAGSVSFIGQGEPLLNKELFAMFEYAARLNKEIGLVTNGALIDRVMAEKLMRSNLSLISISLKGVTPEEFTATTHCHADWHNKVIAGVGYLVDLRNKLKKKTRITLSYVVSRPRLSSMPKAISIAEALNVDSLLFDNFIPFGNFTAEGTQDALFCEDKEAAEFIQDLSRVLRKIDIYWPVFLRRGNLPGCCSSCFTHLGVDSQGNISGCARVLPPSSEYGNIFKDKEAWNSGPLRELRSHFLEGNPDLPQRCKLCVDMSLPASRKFRSN